MAGTTGLEPATSDVTGRRSNQLNYVPEVLNNVGNCILTYSLAKARTAAPACAKPPARPIPATRPAGENRAQSDGAA